MKKIIVTLVVLLLFSVGFRFALGFFPWHLVAALDVATGLGAKIACSGYYISGQSEQQIGDDLASYSPATRLVVFDFSQPNRVVANLNNLSQASATYRPGIGCTLDIGDTQALDNLVGYEIEPAAKPWPMGTVVDTIDPQLQTLAQNIVEQDNQAGLDTRALVVVKEGTIVAEAYGRNVTPSTPLLGWSMGKSLTAMMVGRWATLQEQHNFDIQPVFDTWHDDKAGISLTDLLNMTSGLSFDETYAPGSDSTHMLFSAYSASDVAMNTELEYAPGSHFSYSSGTTNIIARWLYQQLGGTPQASIDFLYGELFAPAGMHTAIFEPDPSGVYVGSSYIYASGRDWARLGWLMVNKGSINDQQLLASEFVRDAVTTNASDNYPAYGYQFWLNYGNESLMFESLPEDAYFMLGNRKQVVMMVPSQNTVIVRLGWTSGSYPTEERFHRLLTQ